MNTQYTILSAAKSDTKANEIVITGHSVYLNSITYDIFNIKNSYEENVW